MALPTAADANSGARIHSGVYYGVPYPSEYYGLFSRYGGNYGEYYSYFRGYGHAGGYREYYAFFRGPAYARDREYYGFFRR